MHFCAGKKRRVFERAQVCLHGMCHHVSACAIRTQSCVPELAPELLRIAWVWGGFL
jgi:hypothetical protein